MIQTITGSCKLKVSPEQKPASNATLQAFVDDCQLVKQHSSEGLTNKLTIQSLVYQQLRFNFGLSANFAIQAIKLVAGAKKVAKQKNKPVKKFALTSVSYICVSRRR